MLVAAVKAIVAQSPALEDPDRGLVPDVVNVREISVQVAKAVIKQAVEENLATEEGIPTSDGDLEEWVREQMWEPRYRPLRRVRPKDARMYGGGKTGVANVSNGARP